MYTVLDFLLHVDFLSKLLMSYTWENLRIYLERVQILSEYYT